MLFFPTAAVAKSPKLVLQVSFFTVALSSGLPVCNYLSLSCWFSMARFLVPWALMCGIRFWPGLPCAMESAFCCLLQSSLPSKAHPVTVYPMKITKISTNPMMVFLFFMLFGKIGCKDTNLSVRVQPVIIFLTLHIPWQL